MKDGFTVWAAVAEERLDAMMLMSEIGGREGGRGGEKGGEREG